MSEETLHNPHLKKNPFTVPTGYFEQVEARWSGQDIRAVYGFGEAPPREDTETLPGKGRGRFIRLLKPQLQLAAGFVLLFGIGYLLLVMTGRNKEEQMPADELSVLNEWSYWGLDHRTVSELVLDDFLEEDPSPAMTDLDVDELLDYMNYPGFDLANMDLNTNNK